MLTLVAAALLDVSVSGSDEVWVRGEEGRISRYRLSPEGEAHLLEDGLDDTALTSSIEKFRHGYWLEEPVTVETLQQLGAYVGRLKPLSATRCRLGS